MKRLVVVPVYNEEKHMEGVLASIKREFKETILVIDDGSTDGSAELIQKTEGIDCITHKSNEGYGRSLIDGFRYAMDNGYDQMVTLDCDEQHQPHRIPEIFVDMEGVDVYSGSRYLAQSESDDAPPPDRYRINMTITESINRITGYNLTDSFCGMKGYRVKALERLDLKESGYAFPIEFWIQAHHFCLSVKEFPVDRIYKNLKRSFGEKLDDPDIRLNYYNRLLEREVKRWPVPSPCVCQGG